ncbi:hypothetical protein BaRGS_00012022 [Batillaria attramentaria]|uniref:Uncharacterized protein n=1 Tax=Batillaria attramentaria TaxID=370345 RepID=A0ABD0LC13_9CAEN
MTRKPSSVREGMEIWPKRGYPAMADGNARLEDFILGSTHRFWRQEDCLGERRTENSWICPAHTRERILMLERPLGNGSCLLPVIH